MNAPRTPMSAQQPPLTGLKVLEFANFFAGPFACMVLADLGADVIKIENPQGGDFSRASAPFIQDEGAGFMAVNRNKRSLSLDLKHPMGREAALALAKSADVVVENFRPGTMQDLGLDYDALKAVNAGIIYCSTSAFGQTGPYGPRAGLDLIVQGMSGLMSITGEPNRPPVKCGAPISDLTGGLYSANAIQAAYIHRLRTGEGQCIDVSLFEYSQGDVWVSEWNTGQVAVYRPATGQWQEWKLPGTRPRAYAVYVDEQDKVWLTDFGGNAILRFDPQTEQFLSVELVSPNANVRQLLGRPGEVWGAQSGADKLVVIRRQQ